MPKHYKHVLIHKVTFSTKKELLTQALHKKTVYQQKRNVDNNQTMLYLLINFLEYT